MKRELTLVLESPYVAIWFFDALIDYSRKNKVTVRLALTGSRRERPAVFRVPILKAMNRMVWKKFPFFEPVDCRKYFKNIALPNSRLVLAAVSKGHFNDMQMSLSRFCLIGPQGHRLVKPGMAGGWFFYRSFFSLATPLTILTDGCTTSREIFFQTRNFTLRKNVGFLQYNLEVVMDRLMAGKPHPGKVMNEPAVSGRVIFKFFGYQVWLMIQKVKENLLHPRWCLLWMNGDEPGKKKEKVKLVKPPSSLAWADPMLVDTPGGLYLFLEEVAGGKGHLSVTELNRDTLRMSEPPRPVLNKATHLSYPFVFKVEGDYYMIPESSSAKEVSIYKSEKFPYQWSLHRTVFSSEQWVDFTLFFHQNKWWMFGVKKETSYASAYQELHLFFCKNPVKDEWMPHPLNPVVSDVRHARPAGPLYYRNGMIIRPAQNCLNRYGGSVMLCRVTELSETRYAERVIQEIKFPLLSRISSFHTIAFYKDKILGDCFLTL